MLSERYLVEKINIPKTSEEIVEFLGR